MNSIGEHRLLFKIPIVGDREQSSAGQKSGSSNPEQNVPLRIQTQPSVTMNTLNADPSRRMLHKTWKRWRKIQMPSNWIEQQNLSKTLRPFRTLISQDNKMKNQSVMIRETRLGSRIPGRKSLISLCAQQ